MIDKNINSKNIIHESISYISNDNPILAINFLLNITHDIIMIFFIRSIPITILIYSNMIINKVDIPYAMQIIKSNILWIVPQILIIEFAFNMNNSCIISILNDSLSVFKPKTIKTYNENLHNFNDFIKGYPWTLIITTIIIIECVIAIKLIEYISINIIALWIYNVGNNTIEYINENKDALFYYSISIGIISITIISVIVNLIKSITDNISN